jgi:hypothetical protein
MFTTAGGVVNQVTSVFAVQRDNPANVIQASNFVIVNPNLIDAFFQFGSANAGRTFLIFATGPGGTSRNLTSLPAGAPAGCPIGNEQGVQVTFTCATNPNPNPGPVPPDIATLSSCKIGRDTTGTFTLDIVGKNIKQGATATVGGKTPKKIKFRDLDTGTNTFNRITLKKGFCGGLPGAVIVTNPGATGGASAPLQCNETCAVQ